MQQVGGVVGPHLLQHVGRPLRLQRLQDADLVVGRQLLQHIGEPDVVERAGDLDAALARQVVQRTGHVGGPQRLERGDQPAGPLVLLQRVEPGDLLPVHDPRLAPPALVDGDLGDLPGGRPDLLHGHVVDRHGLLAEAHAQVEHLADDQCLGGALLEPAHVEPPGEDQSARLDAADPGDGQEDGAARLHLHHEAVDVGPAADPQPDHDVSHAADLVARGVEDRGAR